MYLYTLPEPYNSSASKGKQMMIGGSKSKTAFMDGYFEKKFDRIMEVRNGVAPLGGREHCELNITV